MIDAQQQTFLSLFSLNVEVVKLLSIKKKILNDAILTKATPNC